MRYDWRLTFSSSFSIIVIDVSINNQKPAEEGCACWNFSQVNQEKTNKGWSDVPALRVRFNGLISPELATGIFSGNSAWDFRIFPPTIVDFHIHSIYSTSASQQKSRSTLGVYLDKQGVGMASNVLGRQCETLHIHVYALKRVSLRALHYKGEKSSSKGKIGKQHQEQLATEVHAVSLPERT